MANKVEMTNIYLDYDNRCEHYCSLDPVNMYIDPEDAGLCEELLETFFDVHWMYWEVNKEKVNLNKIDVNSLPECLDSIWCWINTGTYASQSVDVNKFWEIIKKYYPENTYTYKQIYKYIYDEDSEEVDLI